MAHFCHRDRSTRPAHWSNDTKSASRHTPSTATTTDTLSTCENQPNQCNHAAMPSTVMAVRGWMMISFTIQPRPLSTPPQRQEVDRSSSQGLRDRSQGAAELVQHPHDDRQARAAQQQNPEGMRIHQRPPPFRVPIGNGSLPAQAAHSVLPGARRANFLHAPHRVWVRSLDTRWFAFSMVSTCLLRQVWTAQEREGW